ncbi:TraR/DksA C4-type zinc finger protein [Bradyrhizobium sp. 2TAF36]|uniref:TraR/DksA C4-type zinc finger protein n=1 Tax=Bradyrhizobium sp. 2TAF36 TaxID=3233016 RepID=UPI003F8E6156
MTGEVVVRCVRCGRTRTVSIPDSRDPSSLRFRCSDDDCRGRGEVRHRAISENQCRGCSEEIPADRLAAMPGTHLCVDCASGQPPPKKRIKEPWGTRDAWRRDRASWKKAH